MAKKDSKYISAQDYERKYGPEITINDCTPEAWNALGGNYEKDIKVSISLKLIRRSAAIWKCVPPVFNHGVPGALTRYSGAN